jgi:hypothetical protein
LSGRFVIGAGDTFPLDTSGGDFKIKKENLPEHVHGISPPYLFEPESTSPIYATSAGSQPLAFAAGAPTDPNQTTNDPYHPPIMHFAI